MKSPHYRYFIELQPGNGEKMPRDQEVETRCAAARGFIENFNRWLKEQNMDEKVSAMSITMFGQIHITCDSAVIKLIRNREDVDIVAIRQSALHTESPMRWNQAH